MASNLKVDIVRPTATNGSLSLKGNSGGAATTNGITVNSSGNTAITGTTTVSSLVATTADINGGTIDNATIGGTTKAVGSFTQLNADNLRLDANTISSTNSNGNINLQPDGTGEVFTDGPLKVGETAAFLGDHIAVNGNSSIIPSAAGTFFPGLFATAPSSFRFTALENAAVLCAGLYSDNTFKSYRSSTQGAAQITVNAVDSSISFLNTPTTSGTVDSEITDLAERMRIDSSGNLKFNSGYGSVATAYGCRAWVNFDGTGTVAIRASGNVSSITDNGSGDYTVNFTNAMSDEDYALCGNTNSGAIAVTVNLNVGNGGTPTKTTTAVRIATRNNSSAIDVDYTFVSIFR